MIGLLSLEIAKLRKSLALLFLLIVPALTSILAALVMIVNSKTSTWDSIIERFTLPLWAIFLLPMATAVFCTLVGQLEYRARSWDHILSLPVAPWKVFAAKLLVVIAALSIMSVLLLVYTYLLVSAAANLLGLSVGGEFLFFESLRSIAKIIGAALLLSTIQFWSALRFANFAVPLAIGISGTLVSIAVVMTGSRDADWFPWVLPVRVLDASEWTNLVVVSFCSAALLAPVMLLDLSNSRRK